MDEPTIMINGVFGGVNILIRALPSGNYSTECSTHSTPVVACNPYLAVRKLMDILGKTDYKVPLWNEQVATWNWTRHEMDDPKNHYGRWVELNDGGGKAEVIITKKYDIDVVHNGEGGFLAYHGEPNNEHFNSDGDAEIEAVDYVRKQLSNSIDAGFELL